MRYDRLAWRLALAVAPLLAAPDPLGAQRWERPVGVAVREAAPWSAWRAAVTHLRLDSATAPPTTRAQRYWTGLGFATLAGLLTEQGGGDDAAKLAAYLAGSAGGVLLAGHAREGARPVPVLMGTLAGATPIWVGLAERGRGRSLILVGLLTTPLGSAIGHQLGGPGPSR